MPQARYQSLLLERAHAESRWENTPATDQDIADLDEEEILRTLRLGREAGRLPESTPSEAADALDRLGLRKAGRLVQAAVVLFGTRFLPDYPQCHLRLARFKGTDKTEFLDNRQVHGHAFDLLDEAMTFLMRHLPIRGRFESNRLERIDEPLLPTAALREALVNAFCHRDYAIPGGAVSVAIYDDRLEIWSQGVLPFGLRPVDLKGEHTSQPRNPLITGVFYRRGLIEQWGRGTNRIVELCVKAGHPEPDFDEVAGAVVVRFRLVTPEVAPEVTPEVTPEVKRVLPLCVNPLSRRELQESLALRDGEHFRTAYLLPALASGLVERTIPDKPRSRLQKYRLTGKGRAWLTAQGNASGDHGPTV
jgi:ATP-dependent DNA helicase RecG